MKTFKTLRALKALKPLILIAGIAITLATCDNDDNVEMGDTPFLQFVTQMDAPLTRATADNTWTGGELVQVVIDGGAAQTFTAAANDVLTPNPAIYWTSTTQTISARAWHPASWTMQADQSTTANFQAADFIFAPTVSGITQANYATKPLVFGHRTAKVTANLTAGGGISAADIASATVRFYGYTSGTANTTTGTLSGSANGEIAPLKNGGTHTVLLVPQTIATPQWFIKVSIGTKDYYYKPAAGEVNLEAGKSYIYEITVNETGITVSPASITDWNVSASSGLGEAAQMSVSFIPHGTFTMGSSDSEPNRKNDERQHQVTLTKDFYMSRYQVTNAQYAAFLNANHIGSNGIWASGTYPADILISTGSGSGYNWGLNWDSGNSKWVPASGYDNHPVIYVTWYGADEYARWVGGSLPTEAQWEYACRAGTTTAFYFGDNQNDMGTYGWSYENSSAKTQAVGQKQPNAYGLYDMHGNVLEWCSDWYESNYGSGPVTDPVGPATGTDRMLRGGNCSSYAQSCRSAYRMSGTPISANPSIGFRVVFVL